MTTIVLGGHLFGRLLLAPSLLFIVGSVNASSTHHSISLSSSLTHDTNPLMTVTDVESVSKANLRPGYSLLHVDGPYEWMLDASANIERTSDQGLAVDRNDPTLGLKWTRVYPRGAFSLSADYAQSSTRVAELDEIGFSRAAEGSRQNYSLGADWNHELTERLEAILNAKHNQTSYDGGNFSDNQSDDLGLSLNYLLSERATLISNFSINQQNPDGSPSSTRYSASLGLGYEISELWKVDLDYGRILTESTTTATGWNGSFALGYSGERMSGSLVVSHSSSPSVLGGYTPEYDSVNGLLSYACSERINAGLDLGWRENQTTTSKNATLWSSYELSDDLLLRFSYQYKETDSSTQSASGDVWLLSLNYAIPEL